MLVPAVWSFEGETASAGTSFTLLRLDLEFRRVRIVLSGAGIILDAAALKKAPDLTILKVTCGELVRVLGGCLSGFMIVPFDKAIFRPTKNALGKTHRWTKDSARVAADALTCLGRAEEASALRCRYDVLQFGLERKDARGAGLSWI